MSKLKVAVIQLPHVNYDVSGNIQRGIQAIKDATTGEENEGVKLVLLPELFATGYSFTAEELWEMSEILHGGPTTTAIMNISKECNVCVGYTILEATITGDFYNTFVLVEPTGTIHTYRKSTPAALESYVFIGDKSDTNSPILDIESLNCKIGVSICYENWLIEHQYRLLGVDKKKASTDEDITKKKTPFDILLCPHSAITTDECLRFTKQDKILLNRTIEQTPKRMSKLYGVPCLLANKIGTFHNMVAPFPFTYIIPTNHTFYGYSSICSSDGFWLSAARNNLEDVKVEIMVGTIFVGDDNRKISKVVDDLNKSTKYNNSRYLIQSPTGFAFIWTYIAEPIGYISYKYWSYKRRRDATQRAIQRGSSPSTFSKQDAIQMKYENDDLFYTWLGIVALLIIGSATIHHGKISSDDGW